MLFKEKQKANHARSHRTQSQHSLDGGRAVWIQTGDTSTPGQVVSTSNTLRSYFVSTQLGVLHQNRYHLTARPDDPQDIDGDISISSLAI